MNKFKKIYLERTGCLGVCPVYKLYIDAEGNVQLHRGFYYPIAEEIFGWQIDKKALAKLNTLLHKYKYLELEQKEESTSATDFPYCVTSIEFEDGTRRFIDHYLGGDSWPKQLTTIEKGIDRIVGVKDYYQ